MLYRKAYDLTFVLDFNNSCIAFKYTSPWALVLLMLAQWHGLLGHLNETEK